LRLLLPSSGLVAVTIEGASSFEFPNGESVEAGEELIDVGEYYESQDVTQATLVKYIQLKHSTLHANEPWPPSGLEKTLRKFAQRYIEFRTRLGNPVTKLEFGFISNRPITTDFLEAIEDAANGTSPRHVSDHEKLEKFTGLQGEDLVGFCKLLHLEGGKEGYWTQRNLLFQDMCGYLPQADVDGPIQLKELVTQKALSQNAANPSITKIDVLRALKTDEMALLPAPCLIEPVAGAVGREQEEDLVRRILSAGARPVLLHAGAGVGKTVFSTRIERWLPTDSVCILYDCFANGEYRSPSRYRHRHKVGLVQIANELAGNGLCDPLIPIGSADFSAYLSAFLHRLRQSVASIRSDNPAALLCIVVDAADNAQIVAQEISEGHSFIRDLLHENLPEGVRLVALCRTERQHLLDPSPRVLPLELRVFSRAETAAHLRRHFPDATERDVDEFHSLSSHNPRLQAIALSRDTPLAEVLRRLGPNPTTVESAIESLLEDAVVNLRHVAGPTERLQIDKICSGLAILRPLIPISILASMSGVAEEAIKSFAIDLGRPLHVAGGTIQFFDEPAETWFRERFKAKPSDLTGFLEALKPLASSSSYVASTLPQLMLEAGHLSELVNMALSSTGLPETSRIERRDVELQRLQFALKASLRIGRYTDAAKLALKAGCESAGQGRESALLQSNTDLAAVLLDTDRIQEIVSKRTFGSGWLGSHNVYEAGLMSGKVELIGEARSRLRMAREWLWSWSQLSEEQRREERITEQDIAELAMAHFNVHGAAACAQRLRAWTPRVISFRAGRIVAQRFVDHGRYRELDELAVAAANNVWLVLAITLELGMVQRTPPLQVVSRAARLMARPNVKLSDPDRWQNNEILLDAVTAILEAAHRLFVLDQEKLAQILTKYLPDSPPRSLCSRFERSRFVLLRAYALRAALRNEELATNDLAHPELKQTIESDTHSHSGKKQEFHETVGALLPWHKLWADVLLGHNVPDTVSAAIAHAESVSTRAGGMEYRRDRDVANEVARIWINVLIAADIFDAASMEKLNRWIDSLKLPLFTPTLTYLARLAARTESLQRYAPNYAHRAFRIMSAEREDAQSKVEVYVDLARAVLPAYRSEAIAYFDEAVKVAGKVGDENLLRWTAILDLADRAADRRMPVPELAYKLSRCAELTYEYVVRDKHFDWEGTVRAIAGLCGSSSLAILSRWRDRRFGRTSRLLPEAVTFLLGRGDIDGRTALALLAFRAEWDPVKLVEFALTASTTNTEKEAAANFAFRYMTLHGYDARTWAAFKNLLASHKLVIPGVDELGDFRTKTSEPTNADGPIFDAQPARNSDHRDWDEFFRGIDMTASNSLSAAYTRFQAEPPPRSFDEFFTEVCQRIPAGHETAFIRALPDLKDINLYRLRQFLEHFPSAWQNQLSVKHALVDMLKAFCRNFCWEIARHRYYEVFPFVLANTLCGFAESDVADQVLSVLGESSESLNVERLFTLVGLLALKLSRLEAVEALNLGLNLYEDVLEEKDGDGPWSERLAPPADLEGALAGYVWVGLAEPRTNLRWEAAHVVRGLCALGREHALGHVIALAKGRTGGAFADRSLYFYDMHALQWLLIALARAAKDRPIILVPQKEFLINMALNSTPHVLIRGFAAKAALELFANDAVNRSSDLERRLASVNVSPFPSIVSDSYERVERRDSNEDNEDQERDPIYFGIDTGSYWFAPLGRCFALSEGEIERAAKRVIRIDWQYSGKNNWAEDERHKRKIFSDTEAWDSRSDPRTHDLQFYLSYHAVMTVAGELLATHPTHREPNDRWHDFDHWLAGNGLSRSDGRWLADQRDPAPLDTPNWSDKEIEAIWQWAICRSDFDNLLVSPNRHVNVWGNWTVVENGKEESISVRSALVSPGRSEALLRALQSADSFWHGFPAADDDDLEIAESGFQLKGWVAKEEDTSGLDERDPWAGNIDYPPPMPAQFVIDLMGIASDPDHRHWILPSDPKSGVELWSQMWGYYLEKEDEDGHDSGRRLQASIGFIAELLSRTAMELIVKVQIERRRRRTRYEGGKNDEFRYREPSTRFFLFKADGSLRTI
jgi:hypothetical protein